MKISFKPKNKLEKFGLRVYSALVENFSQTFFVGGMPRDILLRRPVTDIDIATEATPEQVEKLLSKLGIPYDSTYKNFGNIVAKEQGIAVEITTFRKELKSFGRYPKTRYIKQAEADSQRRDFTMNALYLQGQTGIVKDFYNGIRDIKNKAIKFIGSPHKRIKQDPLRILRALRFALILNFKLEKNTAKEIKNNFNLIKTLTKSKTEKEINKIKSTAKKKILKEVINNPKLLDKYFKIG